MTIQPNTKSFFGSVTLTDNGIMHEKKGKEREIMWSEIEEITLFHVYKKPIREATCIVRTSHGKYKFQAHLITNWIMFFINFFIGSILHNEKRMKKNVNTYYAEYSEIVQTIVKKSPLENPNFTIKVMIDAFGLFKKEIQPEEIERQLPINPAPNEKLSKVLETIKDAGSDIND